MDHNEIVHLDTRRSPTPQGGSNVDPALRALKAIDEVAEQAERGISATLCLRSQAEDPDLAVASVASTALATIRKSAQLDRPHRRELDARLFRSGRQLDRFLLRVRRRFAILSRVPAWAHRLWLIGGLSASAIVAIAIVRHWWTTALMVLVLRLSMSVMLGDEHNLPFEGRVSHGSRAAIVLRCIAGHVGDAVILLAIAGSLTVAGRPLWALATVITTVTMLFATLYRVAALQVGEQIFRLTLERVARGSTLVAALVVAAVWQPVVPMHALPLLAIAAAGPLLFGIGEIVRTTLRLTNTDQPIELTDPPITILVKDEYGTARPLPYGGRWLESASLQAS